MGIDICICRRRKIIFYLDLRAEVAFSFPVLDIGRVFDFRSSMDAAYSGA